MIIFLCMMVIIVAAVWLFICVEFHLHQRGIETYEWVGKIYDRYNLGRFNW